MLPFAPDHSFFEDLLKLSEPEADEEDEEETDSDSEEVDEVINEHDLLITWEHRLKQPIIQDPTGADPAPEGSSSSAPSLDPAPSTSGTADMEIDPEVPAA